MKGEIKGSSHWQRAAFFPLALHISVIWQHLAVTVLCGSTHLDCYRNQPVRLSAAGSEAANY